MLYDFIIDLILYRIQIRNKIQHLLSWSWSLRNSFLIHNSFSLFKIIFNTLATFSCHKNRSKERHDFWPQLWLFIFPFLFPHKKRGKKKRRMNSKNRDKQSCLSARSRKQNVLKKIIKYSFIHCPFGILDSSIFNLFRSKVG